MKSCSSCGSGTSDYVEFACPSCGKAKVVRCKKCRENENPYKCKDCGFEGP